MNAKKYYESKEWGNPDWDRATASQFDKSEMFDFAEHYASHKLSNIKKEDEDRISAYKECFELFIPTDKWDEANEFLSTYRSGLAKELAKREK